MSRIAFPWHEIYDFLSTLDRTFPRDPHNPEYIRNFDHYRLYARISGKFKPIGWLLEWDTGDTISVLDSDFS